MLPRLCQVGDADDAAIRRASALGFSGIVAAPENGALENRGVHALAEVCASQALDLFLDFDFSQWDINDEIVARYPACFSIRRESAGEVVDPREPRRGHGRAFLRNCDDFTPIVEWGAAKLGTALAAGAKGFRAIHPDGASTKIWAHLITDARERCNRQTIFIADTTGVARAILPRLEKCGFDFSVSSLPWWDTRANWLIEEHEALSRIAPVMAQVDSPARIPPASSTARRTRLALAALTGSGLMMPLGFADDAAELDAFIRSLNSFVGARKNAKTKILKRSGAGANVTVLMCVEGTDPTLAEEAFVVLVNPHPSVAAEPGPETTLALGDFNALQPVFERESPSSKLPPGAARVFHATRSVPVRVAPGPDRNIANAATGAPRIVIRNVTPCVEGGNFPARRIAGEQLIVEADIFTDGHPLLAAELSWRTEDERSWHRTHLMPLENDRWRGAFELPRIGRYRFAVSAWIDSYGGFVRDLLRKRDDGQDVEVEAEEGLAHLKNVRTRASGAALAALDKLVNAFEKLSSNDRVALLTAPETVQTVTRADERRFLTRSQNHFVEVERQAARFASWYELFPRSQTENPARSGTLRDVIDRLPAVSNMGFDVLYMTPIHPIGRSHRKGRNNALEAGPGDPGSTYAIGGREGGHETIHPDLGSMEDFRALVMAAHEHGMEVALDFAIQCSRDHPWLAEHRTWFAWRPDGSIHFAENPPKKYEDIVNVDFYAPGAVPDAWLALRDIVLHWIDAGVRIFRVDNPHTKPFPFWEWMIADVRARHPNTIFLSEAFTRPKVMYRLAQLGFSQSYTYFTWRNTKRELTEYLTELTQPPVSDFFRPHFFVNTPDINPYFLQTSGRSGFLIRAALAATLSGLWGMYSGFELCEAEPLPGREEYMNSEKYEIKPRDWNAPGNIVAEITLLNRLRKEEPALQSHLGLTFYNAFNENVIYYGKSAPGHRDRILVAVSLDPHNAQETDFEIPLWEWGLSDDRALECEDLLRGTHWVWHGKIQHMRLQPDAPYAIWRVRPAHEI